MRAVLALALLLFVAPALSATETDPAPRADVVATVEAAVTDAAPEAPAPILEKVDVERRATSDQPEAAVQDMPSRGSFWWLVGVIVVAGVLLAVLLD